MAKLTEIAEEGEERVEPKSKKPRLDSDSEDIDGQDEPDDEKDEGEDELQEEEIVDDEEDYEEVDQVLAEEESQRSTETQKIDEDCDYEDDESKEENQHKFFLTDLEFFDCTVCLHRLTTPIVYLCENEHVACSGCFASLNSCTICTPVTPYRRCRILEKILSSIGQLCENFEYGCKRPVHYTQKDDHQRFCKFATCSCPIEGCSFAAPSIQLAVHVSTDHSESVSRFSFDRLYSLSLKYDERFCTLQELESNELFVITNVKHDIGNMIGVSQIGPCTFRSPFSLDLNAKDGKRSLQFKSEIESIRGLGSDKPLILRDFLLVPNRYFEDGEAFELLIRIFHSGN